MVIVIKSIEPTSGPVQPLSVSSAACAKSYHPLQVAHVAGNNSLSGLFLCLYCIPAATPGELAALALSRSHILCVKSNIFKLSL